MSTVEEIFQTVVNRFDPEKMAGFNTAVVFDLTGEDGKAYHVLVEDGSCSYGEGGHHEPDATLSMSVEDFKAMSSGELNPMMAFMQGKIKVDGNMGAVMKLQTLLTG